MALERVYVIVKFMYAVGNYDAPHSQAILESNGGRQVVFPC